MGKTVKTDGLYEYQQEDGTVTAQFSHIEEKMELIHKGNSFYKKMFYVLISFGILYLGLVFTFIH